MKRIAKLVSHTIVLLAVVIPFRAGAGEEGGIGLEDEFALLEEADVVESAARHKQDIGMSPSAITVITRKDIEASGATTIPDMLRQVPGMDVIIVSPSQNSVTSRLFWTDENNHYLVLIDGREANIELLGQAPWEIQPLIMEDIERIEILRGPASSLYGASAMAGVISITTRAVPEKTSAFASVAGGELGRLDTQARGSTRIGNFGFSLSGGVVLANSFVSTRARGMHSYKLRAYGEYRFDESRRIVLDTSIADASGIMASSIGTIDIGLGIRAVRLAYESEDIRARFYWTSVPAEIQLEAMLEVGGVNLAGFAPAQIGGHILDTEVQWKLPTFWQPLLIIVGANGRASFVGSDDLLSADYADPNSSGYHEVGVDEWEFRGGTFVHGELSPADWVTVTAGLRFDANTETDWFLSPRVAAVFSPVDEQFLRVGVARAFRKPCFAESKLHVTFTFPPESPITGSEQTKWQEFAARTIGNEDTGNETLLSFEAGYLGRFLDGDLTIALDLYYNRYRDMLEIASNLAFDESGFPDIDATSVRSEHVADLDIIGGELSIRYSPIESLRLLASYAHREVYDYRTGRVSGNNPKNLITLGGRFNFPMGLIGSLYVHTRSEFVDDRVNTDEGILAPRISVQMDKVFVVLARLGWRFDFEPGVELEAGAKLFLPVSPFSAPHFSYYEEGGGISPEGTGFGGEPLRRYFTFYLQGSF